MCDEEEKDMIREEDIKTIHKLSKEDRKKMIRSMIHKICDRNDEGLRRLSKN